jgi:hypothetical protein
LLIVPRLVILPIDSNPVLLEHLSPRDAGGAGFLLWYGRTICMLHIQICL